MFRLKSHLQLKHITYSVGYTLFLTTPFPNNQIAQFATLLNILMRSTYTQTCQSLTL